MIVHIDCNSYFASCEIADHPELADKPVIVSSSNDNNGGIILALNKPAKQLGLKRGLPIFQAFKGPQPDELFAKNQEKVFFFAFSIKIICVCPEKSVILYSIFPEYITQ